MLQEMRKYTKSWVSSIFLGVLALSFVGWGIADVFTNLGGNDNAFSVGSTDVPVEAFAREYRVAARNVGQVLTPDQSRVLGQQVLDQMTMRIALDNLVHRYGLTAGNGRIQQSIQSAGAFSGPLGSFDHDRFLRVIGEAGYSEADFIERTRQDLARGQMIGAVSGGFQVPPDYGRAIFAYLNEIRAAQFIVLTDANAGDVAPPSEAVLATYVRTHPQWFSTPDYRSVSYAAIGADDIAKTIVVGDKDIQAEIDADKADYVTPERRTLEQINFPSQADANAARAEIDRGKTFDALAAERHLKDADYKLGDVAQIDLDSARKVAFTLPANGVSAPVKSTFGWAIMHVVAITPGSAKSHDEVKAILQKRLALAKMTDIANAYTDAIGGGASTEEAAHKAGMRFVHVAAIDDQGLAPDGSKALDTVDPELLSAIFKAEIGEDGDPFQTTDASHYYAIHVDGETPPKVKPLDLVRAQALSRWIAEQKIRQLRAKANALAARANQEHSLAGAAAAVGSAVQTSDAMNRRYDNKGLLDAAVVTQLFAAPPGGAIAAQVNSNTFLVARVSGVRHPSPPVNDFRYIADLRQFSDQVAADIVQSLARAQQKADKLTINQKLVDTTTGNSGSGS